MVFLYSTKNWRKERNSLGRHTYCLGCNTTALTDFLWFVNVTLVFPATKSHSRIVVSWLPVMNIRIPKTQIRKKRMQNYNKIWSVLSDTYIQNGSHINPWLVALYFQNFRLLLNLILEKNVDLTHMTQWTGLASAQKDRRLDSQSRVGSTPAPVRHMWESTKWCLSLTSVSLSTSLSASLPSFLPPLYSHENQWKIMLGWELTTIKM